MADPLEPAPAFASESPPVPDGATCALHEGATATGTCERCGNYVCATCTDFGATAHCPTCRERLGLDRFPISRDRFEIGEVFSLAWSSFQADSITLSTASFVLLLVEFAFGVCGRVLEPGPGRDAAIVSATLSLGIGIVHNLVQAGLTMGLIRASFLSLDRRSPQLGAAYTELDKLGKWVVQALVLGLGIGAPVAVIVGGAVGLGLVLDDPDLGLLIAVGAMVVLAIPLLYVGLGVYFTQYEIVYDPDVGAIEAIRRSWKIASGFRLQIFAIGLLGGLLLAAGVVLCCVGLVFTQAYYYVLLSATYRALRNGAGLPEPEPRL